jgi:LysM repeat protein
MGDTSGGSEKAFFTNAEKTSEVFYVQFNPKEFKLDDKAAWKDSPEHENTQPLLTYEKGDPTKVAMELYFDTTDAEEGKDNCYEVYVKKLRSFLQTTIEDKDKENNQTKRPPYLTFQWGKSFKFECVLESISTTFLMFKADGTPLRAKVSLALKERQKDDLGEATNSAVTLTAMGSMFSGSSDAAKTTTVQEGDTANSIAAKTGGDARDIAAANGWSDPANPPVGETAVIPADSELATVLAQMQLGSQEGNWADEESDDPFSEIIDAAMGAAEEALSAFDDPGELGVDVTSQYDE